MTKTIGAQEKTYLDNMAANTQKKVEGMDIEQQKDGLFMGRELFEGRIKCFLEETAKEKSIPLPELSLFISVYAKDKIRFDAMRQNGTAEIQHIKETAIYKIMGIPEVLAYVINRKLKTAIFMSLNTLAEDEKLQAENLAYHITSDMQLSVFNEKTFYKKLDINQIIQNV